MGAMEVVIREWEIDVSVMIECDVEIGLQEN